MKKFLYTLVISFAITANAYAQVPEKMSYQAVIRNANNTLVATQSVGMQISILQSSASGTAVYVETQTAITNQNGLISIEIGSGTVVSGNMSSIDWSNGTYFIKTETDPTGGSSYTISGTSQLLSVPFALHAAVADSISGGVSVVETDPLFIASVASGISSADTANWNNFMNTQLDSTGVANLGFVAGPKTIDTQIDSLGIAALGYVAGPKTVDTDTQLDSLGIANLGYVAGAHTIDTQIDSLGIVNLGFVAGPKTIDTDTQLSESQVDAFVSNNGYLTTEVDGSITNEIQALSISNDTVYLSNGGFVKLPAGFDGDFSNLTNVPSGLADGDDNTQLSESQVDAFVSNNGYLTTEVDGSITNEIQVLSINNRDISLSNGGGTITLPADLDTQIDSAGIAALGFVAGEHSKALVYKGTAIAKNESSSNPNVNNEIQNGTLTTIRWNSLSNNYQNSIGGANNTTITVPTGVRFIRINSVINFDQNLTPAAGGKAQYIIYKNGNPFTGLTNSGYMTYQYFNYAYTHNYHSTLIAVVPGDEFTINIFQNSGASLYLAWGSISSAVAVEFYE